MPRRFGHDKGDGKGRASWATRARRHRIGTKIKESNKARRRKAKE